MKKPVVVLAVLAAFMAGFDHLLRYKLLVQIKHPVHQPPFSAEVAPGLAT